MPVDLTQIPDGPQVEKTPLQLLNEKYAVKGFSTAPQTSVSAAIQQDSTDQFQLPEGLDPKYAPISPEERKKWEEYDALPGIKKFGLGIEAGAKNLAGGVKYLTSELLPYISSVAIPGGRPIDFIKSEMQPATDKIKQSAIKTLQSAPEGKGLAYDIGTYIPQMAGTLGSVLLAPFTGGTSLSALPAILGTANSAMLATSVIGNSLHDYDQYLEVLQDDFREGHSFLEGQDQFKDGAPISQSAPKVEPLKRWGVALASGAAEFAMEKLRLSRLLPDGVVGKMMGDKLISNPNLTSKMMRTWAKNDPKAWRKFVQFSGKTGMSSAEEGVEEGVTEFFQSWIENVYLKGDDKNTFNDLVNSAKQGVKGGLFMGGVFGGASYKSDKLYQKLRRNKTGVTFIETHDGNVYEFVGRDKDGNILVQDNLLNPTILTKDDVKEYQNYTAPEVQQYLDVYKNAQDRLPELEEEFKVKRAKDQINEIGTQLIFNTPEGPVIRIAKDSDGKPLYVSEIQSDPVAGEIAVVRDAETLDPKMVPVTDLQDIYDLPYNQWLDKETDEYLNNDELADQQERAIDEEEMVIKDAQEASKAEQGIPSFDIGQKFEHQGRIWRVADTGTDGSINVDEVLEGDSVGENMDISAQELIEIGQAAQERVLSDGKTEYPFQDGVIQQPFPTKKAAETAIKQMEDIYPKLDFTYTPVESDDAFTPTTYQVSATPQEQTPPKTPLQVSETEDTTKTTTESTYTNNGEPVTKGFIQGRVITAKSPQDLQGLEWTNDIELDNQVEKKFPETKVTYTYDGNPIESDVALGIIDGATELADLDPLEINNDSELYDAFLAKGTILSRQVADTQEGQKEGVLPEAVQEEITEPVVEEEVIPETISEVEVETPTIVEAELPVQEVFEDTQDQIVEEVAPVAPEVIVSPVVEDVAQAEVTKQDVEQAESEVNTDPTEDQKKAGNYKMGHTTVQGFDITIENPAGSIRSGTDSDGETWQVEMKNTYGYFKRTMGKDGDQIDVFLGPNLDSDKVFVVDQVDTKTKDFDEHKVMMGFNTEEQAKEGYLANYDKGWQGLGAITPLTLDQFKEWLDTGTRKSKPSSEYANIQEATPIERKAYKDTLKAVPDMLKLKNYEMYRSGEMGDPIMPFSVEKQDLPDYHRIYEDKDAFKLIMEHNFIQNGDLMTDPRIDVAVYPNLNAVVPLNFENNTMGFYQEIVADSHIIDEKAMKDVSKFMTHWMNNLKQQGRVIRVEEKPTVGVITDGEAIRVKRNNRLIDLVEQYNKIPANHTTKKAQAFQPINNFASQLDYVVEQKKGKIAIRNAKGAKIRRINDDVDYTSLDEIGDPAYIAFARPIFSMNENLLNIDIPVYGKALIKAANDAMTGRKNANSHLLITEMKNMYDQGEIRYRQTETSPPFSITINELQNLTDDALLLKFDNKYGAFDITTLDNALEEGLITKEEYPLFKQYFENELKEINSAEAEYWNAIRPQEFQGETNQVSTELIEGQKTDGKQVTPTQDVERTARDTESDSTVGETEVQANGQVLPTDTGERTGRGTEGGGIRGETDESDVSGTGERSVGPIVVGDLTTLFGEPSDNTVPPSGRGTGDAPVFAGDRLSGPSDQGSDAGASVSDTQPTGGITEDANGTTDPYAEKQLAQENAPTDNPVLGNQANIQEQLPYLHPSQHEDVVKAEKRLFVGPTPGKGILFTNATGTGKTFTGLGIMKRMESRGKGNQLLVVPTDVKAKDWVRDGKKMGLDITQLNNIKDAGKGIVVTTYANFYQNQGIKKREFDLVMYDESHYIMANQKGQATAVLNAHFKNSNKNEKWALERLKDNTGLWIRENEIRHAINEFNKTTNSFNEGVDAVDIEIEDKIEQFEQELQQLKAKQDDILPSLEEQAPKAAENTKATFLSATPFKSHFTLRYGDGYLFNMGSDESGHQGYNQGSSEDNFFISNFGYRMRTNKLTRPEGDVDVPLLEREFVSKMVKDGAMSGRMLETDFDYSREFPIVADESSEDINEGISLLLNSHKKEDPLSGLNKFANYRYRNYLYSNQLFEAMKSSLIKPRVQKHLDLDRKVVLFHRYKDSNVQAPFDFDNAYYEYYSPKAESMVRVNIQQDKEAMKSLEYFKRVYPQYQTMDFDLRNTIDQMTEAFPGIRVFNGDVSKKERRQIITDFQNDDSGTNIILVQEQAGREGIDLHDITGKHPRALINLAMPVDPITALQSEGRINRLGLQSNAVIEYPTLGLDLESYHFGNKINERVGTTENLAMGNKARDLRTSFKDGFLNANTEDPNLQQGTGGKEFDKSDTLEETEPFTRARALYFTNKKKTSRDKAREGQDYFATPEPVGFKMMEWAGLEPGDAVLEPSAGHGAIARFSPDRVTLTAVEPSSELFNKLSINADGKIVNSTFEDLDIHNKYDAVVMNPPFGSGGKTAMEHVEKAYKHIQNGGRIIALLPDGPAMQKRLDKFLYGKDDKGKDLTPDVYVKAEIKLPSVTFERAGTKVATKIVILDKLTPEQAENASIQDNSDLSGITNINELFDRLEDISIEDRQGPVSDQAEIAQNQVDALAKQETQIPSDQEFPNQVVALAEQTHSRTGDKLFTAILLDRIDREVFTKAKAYAKSKGGYWSRYNGGGMKPGFIFKTEAAANEFIFELNSSTETDQGIVRFRKTGESPAITKLDNELKDLQTRLSTTRKAKDAKKKELSKKLNEQQTIRFAGDIFKEEGLFEVKKDGSQENIDRILSEFDNAITGIENNISNVEAQLETAREEDKGQMTLFRKREGDETTTVFYSNTEDALVKIKQDKATPDQWKAMLLKNGSKQAELDWMGWDDFAKGKSLTKDQVQEWIDVNKIEIVEVEKGLSKDSVSDFTSEDHEKFRKELIKEDNLGFDDYFQARHAITQDSDWANKWNISNQELIKLGNEYRAANARRDTDLVRYEDQQLPGGDNYKEVLLTIPAQSSPVLYSPQQIGNTGRWIVVEDNTNKQHGTYEFPKEETANLQADRLNTKLNPDIFHSGHFEEPNVVAHVRFNDRVGPDGKNILFIEEIQSDWAQQGRREGFISDFNAEKDTEKQERESELKQIQDDLSQVIDQMYEAGLPTGASSGEHSQFANGSYASTEVKQLNARLDEVRNNKDYEDIQDRLTSISRNQIKLGSQRETLINNRTNKERQISEIERLRKQGKGDKVPDIPFKKTSEWSGLVMRKMIKKAVDEGYDAIAWTSGQQQVDRYSLDQHIKRASLMKVRDGKYSLVLEDKQGFEIAEYRGSGKVVTPLQLQETVGKELARKLIDGADASKGKPWPKNSKFNPEFFELSGLDLAVGGEGMKKFYDNIIPSTVNKIGKKYNSKVNTAEINVLEDGEITQTTVHSLPINKDLLTAFQGQVPLFKKSEFAGEKIDYKTNLQKKDVLLRGSIDRLSKELNTPIKLVHTRADLPKGVQRQLEKQAQPNERVTGVYDGDTAYVIFSETNTVDEAIKTVLHEVVAHHGMREKFGDEYDQILDQVYLSMSAEDISTIQQYYGKLDPRETADEYIALMAEGNIDQSTFDKVIAWFRRMFRKVHNLNYSKKDIVSMLNRSRDNLVGKDAPKTSDFDSAGAYLEAVEAYHGTGQKIKKFKSAKSGTGVGNGYVGWGLYFTDNKTIGKSYAQTTAKYDRYLNTATKKIGAKATKKLDIALLSKNYNYNDALVELRNKVAFYENSPIQKAYVDAEKYLSENMLPKNRYVYNVLLANKKGSPLSVMNREKPLTNDQATRIYNQMQLEEITAPAIETALWSQKNAGEIYTMMSAEFGNDKEASQFFSRASIDGMKYDVGTVTEAEKGKTGYNYVIYDDDNITVRNRLRFRKRPTPEIDLLEDLRGPPPNMVRSNKDKARVTFQDKNLGIRKWQDAIKERGGKVGGNSNPYRQENLSHGIVKAAIERFDDTYIDPILETASAMMKKAGMTYDDLNNYMKAKHAPERNIELFKRTGKDVNAGMSTLEADEITSMWEDKIPKEMIREFWGKVNDATDFSLKRNLDDGFISRDTYEKIKKAYTHYVPLRSWKKTATDDLFEYMEKDVGRTVNPNRRAQGRTSEADDPLKFIMSMAHTSIVTGEKNRIKQHAGSLIRNNKDMNNLHRFKKTYWVWDGTTDEDGKKSYTEVTEKPAQELFDKGYVETKYNVDHMSRRSQSQSEEHEVEVWINGDKYTLVVPADVAAGLNKTPSQWDQVSYVTQPTIGKLTRWLSSNFTSKNPAFIPINMIRDLQYATLSHLIKGEKGSTKEFMKALPKARKAIIKSLKGKTGDAKVDSMYKDFVRNGGETGYIHMMDVDQLEKNLKKELKRMNRTNIPIKAAQRVITAGGKMMEHLAIRSENLSRFATYMVSIEQGKSPKQAAQDAKDITVNFNRKGRISSLMGSLYAFFNASLQGGQNILKLGKDHPGKFAAVGAGFMAMGFMQALMNDLWSGDDDDDGENDYKELNDYMKYNNMVISVPGKDKFVTIPLPHGFRWFNSLGVIAYETITDQTKGAGHAVKDGLSNLFAAVSPVNPVEFLDDGGKVTSRPLWPTGVVPAFDIASNTDFTGGTIRRAPFTKALEGKMADSDLGKPYVNKTIKGLTDYWFKLGGGEINEKAPYRSKFYKGDDGELKEISEFFDVNPSNLEHSIEYYLGGRGKFWNNVLKTSVAIMEGANDVVKEDKEFKEILDDVSVNNIPVIRRLYSQPWSNSVYTKYYDIIDDLANFKSTASQQTGATTGDAVDQYYEFIEDELKYLKKDLKYLNEDLEDLTDSEQIKEIKDAQEQLTRTFVETVTKFKNDER